MLPENSVFPHHLLSTIITSRKLPRMQSHNVTNSPSFSIASPISPRARRAPTLCRVSAALVAAATLSQPQAQLSVGSASGWSVSWHSGRAEQLHQVFKTFQMVGI